MKKIILSMLAISVPVLCSADDVKIVSVLGSVEYRTNQNAAWQNAQKDTLVPEGGAVKTNEGGGAIIQMENRSTVWLKENTALEIEQKQSLITRLALVFGKIKVRVPHLRRKEKFDLRTPTAVCAVRGAEFVVESDMEGRMNLQVLFGEVKMTYAITPQKGDREITITQGSFLKIDERDKSGQKGLMNRKQELAGLEKWDPGMSDSDRVSYIKQKENDREQIRDFARQIQNTHNMVSGFISRGREADIEAGRTLLDVHGNLVRVDQRLMRPDGSTVQFFNLVKRKTYADYTNASAASISNGFKYYGGANTDRLDLMVFTMNFNRDLPQSISQWPGFFGAKDVHANNASFVFANKTDNTNIFFIADSYRYDQARGELINNTNVINYGPLVDEYVLMTGSLTGANAFENLSHIMNFNVEDDGSGTGSLRRIDNQMVITGAKWGVNNMSSSYEYTGNDAGTDQLYQFRADKYAIGNNSGANGSFWLAQENYVISNSGKIKNVSDFTNSSSDPFSLLKESALETVMYVKIAKSNTTSLHNSAAYDDIDNSVSGDKYTTANIDLVIIPDLAIAGVQKAMSAINSLNK